jgi:anaerobic selenocysteine-containing dehydrogenase
MDEQSPGGSGGNAPAKPVFAPYNAPAGGWGALHATAKALREQSVLLKGSKALLRMNQPDGFDCPGCAWPDPQHTSSFDFCENGAKAVSFELTKRRVTLAFFAEHSVRELEQESDYWLEEQGRLTEPMRYDAATDRYVPIAWDDAFALIARELNALDDPNEAEFYTSGRTSNEAAFMYQLFVRRFGTNNFPDCSNMCHEPTSVGLPESIGIGKGTVLLDDFADTEAIFIIGQNPGTNSPRMLTELHAASCPSWSSTRCASARSSASQRRRTRSRWRPSARRASPANTVKSVLAATLRRSKAS